jgi:hypothetical protein
MRCADSFTGFMSVGVKTLLLRHLSSLLWPLLPCRLTGPTYFGGLVLIMILGM